MFWDYEIVHSSLKTTAKKTLALYNEVLFQVSKRETEHFENTNYPKKSRCNVLPDWLRATMAQIVLSLQLAKTDILTPYTVHLTFDQEFFCI